ncbi:MAG TPA: Abi-alpha family protein [Bacteroidia bacterium]|nr:Abi-alpha family protein [Bacteroidia bacterium]
MEDDQKGLDILGIKPISKAIDTTVTKTFEGIESFLGSVCKPALDEIGLMLRDTIRNWKLKNILRIIEKAKGKIDQKDGELHIKAHPRVALSIIENGSVIDDDEIQELWAGLFASSCTKEEQDDENLIFADLLKQLTLAEAKILKYSCINSKKIIHANGLITSANLTISCDLLSEITGIKDAHRLDRELDHLTSLDLIGSPKDTGGFKYNEKELIAEISPSALALNLYVRCQGSTKFVSDYFKKDLITAVQYLAQTSKKIKIDTTTSSTTKNSSEKKPEK